MKKAIKEYYNQFKLNKLFHGTMKSYFLIACMVFIAYAVVLLVSVTNAALSQITTAQGKMLFQAETTNDFILRGLTSAATNVFETESAGIDAMTKPYSAEISVNATNLMNDMKLGCTAIDRVYFFNLKNDLIYTGDNPVYTEEEFPDKELLSIINSSGRYTMNIPHILKYEDSHGITEKPTLVSIYKYSDTASMAVFIDAAFYNSMINANYDNPDQNMFVLSNNGIVISSTEPDLFGKDMSDSKIVKKLYESENTAGFVTDFGTIYCYRKSDTLNSAYVCSIKLSSILVSYSWQISILMLFALLLVLLYFVSSIRMSMSIFRPFRTLRSDVFGILGISVPEDENESGTENDLKQIADSLINIKNKYDSMRENEFMYTETKRSELVYNIITGAYNYSRSDLDEYRINLKYPYSTVMLIRLDNAKQIDRSEVGLTLYGIANAGAEIFTRDGSVAYYTTYSEEYDVTFLINHNETIHVEEYIVMLQKYIKNMFNISVSASYGTEANSLDNISELYRRAKYAMQYRLVRGHGSIINYKDLITSPSTDHEYPAKLEKDIIRAINMKDKDKTSKIVDDFITTISKMPYVYIIIHSSILIMAIIAHMKSDNRIEDNSDIISDEITKSETIDDIRDSIMSKCSDALIASSDARIDDKYLMIANSIQEYIDSHYTDPNLSIDTIASYVNKSANYTRTIFKQNKGISISEYISKKRFDEVCRLLRETNLTAQQISRKTGMSSSSYFYTAFKKYTGYTLEQYRKKHMHNDK